MIRGRTTYVAPTDRDGLVDAMAAGAGAAVPIAGGTMVLPTLERSPGTPRRLIDLSRAGLGQVALRDDVLTLGAAVSYAHAYESLEVAMAAPVLARAAKGITGGRAIQAQGTIGGSACYANPASDMPACLTALDARLTLASLAGSRAVGAERFFTGAYTTACRPDEVLVEIVIPARRSGRDAWGYYKFKLCEGSWPVATATCALELDADGRARGATVVLGGVAATPVRVDVSSALTVAEPAAAIAELARAAVTEPWEDVLASGAYRRDIAGAVAARAYRDACAHAEDEHGGT